MAWIESHSVLLDHKKVRECAAILGIKKVHFIGHIHCLWHKVIDLAEDGVITEWTDEDISYYAQWDGDPQLFAKTLSGRFIDEKNGKKVVHDWLDYAWKYLYRKYHTANPKRLIYIQKIHKKIGKPKGKPKGSPLVVLPNQPNQPNQPTLSLSPEALRLSGILADLILENNPNNVQLRNGGREKTVERWSDDIEKMMRLDQRQPQEIERIIRWSQGDKFWKGNILSGEKLRKQFDTLLLRANEKGGPTVWD
jgi:hypothetical protein